LCPIFPPHLTAPRYANFALVDLSFGMAGAFTQSSMHKTARASPSPLGWLVVRVQHQVSQSKKEELPMCQLAQRLWNDDSGALLSFEWILLATILVLAMVVGLKAVQQAVLNEFEDVANAIGALNQTYHVGSARGCCASVGGSRFKDHGRTFAIDTCTGDFHRFSAPCEE
jgi:Flp pilus assembly pilin Flp